jgi:membrane protease YdiL (CAAX protease family)
MSEYFTLVAECIELALAGLGCVLLWRHVLSPGARARRQPAPLPEWTATLPDFLVFVLYVVTGGLLSAVLATAIIPWLGVQGDARVVFSGALGQFGLLGGVAVHRAGHPGAWSPAPRGPGVFVAGAATFLMSLPLLIVVSKGWELLLHLAGLPTQKQNLVDMFLRADSRLLLVVLIGLATIVAPVTEELVFRAGLFRYFRTRLPRWLAFLLPAVLFAALHVDNWKTLEGFASFAPLVALAVFFSAAYERTGRIGTSIVAHALFNLNTVLLIFAGVT